MRRLSGSDRFIADYLSEEVLGGQEPELRDFIVDMSVFDRFNAALANEAAQISSAAGLLHRLERDNAFLIPLPEAGWYRFHHLFAAYAQATLEVEHPERVVDLHRRGARWFAFHDHTEDAIGHLLAAGDTDEAAQLIQRHWVRYVDAGRSATVTGWLQALRGTPADQGAAATVTGAWMAALTGDSARAGTPAGRPGGHDHSHRPPGRHDVAPVGHVDDPRVGRLRRPRPDAHRRPGRARAREQPRQPLARGGAGRLGPCRIRHRRPSAGTTPPRRSRRSARSPRVPSASSPTPSSRCARPSKATCAASRRHAQLAMAVVTDHAMQADPNVLPAYTALRRRPGRAGPPTGSDGRPSRSGLRSRTPGAQD